jgi:GntR family transcriptional regulator
MFAIDHYNPLPLYAQLDRAIRLAVATGKLRRGDQLPTVRQLAVDLRINANTVAKVYAELERTGVVETQRGVGTFIQNLGDEARSVSERRRQLAALADEFLDKAVVLGFTQQDALESINTRSKHRRRERSDG